MLSPRAAKWLHRIGYVCTAIVAVEAIGIGTMVTRAWLETRALEGRIREENRTHDGPLAFHQDHMTALINQLPPLAEFTKGGLRFAVMPAFFQSYAVSLRDAGNHIEGTVVTDPNGSVTHFVFPRDAYTRLMQNFDTLTDGYPGGGIICLDGTGVAFERIRKDRITSGSGNGCTTHYNDAAKLVRTAIQPFANLPSR